MLVLFRRVFNLKPEVAGRAWGIEVVGSTPAVGPQRVVRN